MCFYIYCDHTGMTEYTSRKKYWSQSTCGDRSTVTPEFGQEVDTRRILGQICVISDTINN